MYRDPLSDPGSEEVRTAKLPGWRFVRRPKDGNQPVSTGQNLELAQERSRNGSGGANSDGHRPTTGLGSVSPDPRMADASAINNEFVANRTAARYEPRDAVLDLDGRPFAVGTVSLSGLSFRAGTGRLPRVGDRLEVQVDTRTPVAPFGATVIVTRIDAANGLVAGRFTQLSGTAMDSLLAWLSALDRRAAESRQR